MNEIRPIFGVECEMAFSPLDERHRRVDYDNLWWDFLRIARARYRHLPGQESTGVFLANGARLYLDGLKPEITTPEVTNPTDACRYIRAGEEILWDISRQMIRELDEVHEVVITRNNVHYGSRATAWGCHESYGHRCESAELPAAFIPHAVSRIIFTGAGGFDNHSPGTRFLISPRVPHLWAVSSRHTQENRGIFNLKDEPLNEAGIQRLHVICGEHQCSLSAQWLKLATTALVVAMAQAGVKPGHGLALCEPLTAMRDFAADTTLTATAAMGDGSRMTALDIQRRLLKKAKSFSFAGPLNDWHADACQLWERTLDQLQHDRSAAQRSIDWAIKHDLFTCHLEARGLSWEQLEQWDVILERSFQLYGAEKGYMGCWSHPLTKEELRDWLYEHRRELDPRRKVNWKDLERLLATRYELFELDSRFGELGDRGIFHQLDQLDLLNHHVPGVENISEAITDPPSDTRARARGLAIQEIALRGDEGACEWDGLWDTCKNRRLDLSDPFETQRRWEQLERRRPQFVRFRRLQVSTAFGDAMKCFERGEYDAALTLLTGLQHRLNLLPAEMLRQFYRLRAWTTARCGWLDGEAGLNELYNEQPWDFSVATDYLTLFRFVGLMPGREYHQWCRRAAQLAANADPQYAIDLNQLNAARAFSLLERGHYNEAADIYRYEFAANWQADVDQRFVARVLTERAELSRRRGEFADALDLLLEAERKQVEGCLNGDLADLTWMVRAKVAAQQGHHAIAWVILDKARRSQRAAVNVVGEARTLMLMARIEKHVVRLVDPELSQSLPHRVQRICSDRTALRVCPLAQKILSHWDLWTGGYHLSGERDTYWGL